MYDEPEYNEYDDDEYKFYPNEYNEHGYPKAFKFDWASWEKWLSQAIKEIYEENSNTWENLFEAKVDPKNPARLKKYNDEELDELLESLVFGVQEYATKCGFKKFVIALSGGMDSA